MQKILVPHPKSLARESRLVLIPEREYDLLTRTQKRSFPEVHLSSKERAAVVKGERELLRGNSMTLDELDYAIHGGPGRRNR